MDDSYFNSESSHSEKLKSDKTSQSNYSSKKTKNDNNNNNNKNKDNKNEFIPSDIYHKNKNLLNDNSRINLMNDSNDFKSTIRLNKLMFLDSKSKSDEKSICTKNLFDKHINDFNETFENIHDMNGNFTETMNIKFDLEQSKMEKLRVRFLKI